jgi:DNA-binding ferritin-like protein
MAVEDKDVADFVSTLLHSGTVAHFMHLGTDSLGVHLATGDYYTAIIDLVDQFAEAYMGCYSKKIKNFPENFHNAKDPMKYFESLSKYVETNRKAMPDDTQLQNIIDEIAQLIDSTLFRLTLK